MFKLFFVYLIFMSSMLFGAKVYNDSGIYFKNGVAYEKSTNKLINGERKVYHRNGKLKFEAPYVDGRVDGVMMEYYKSGKIENVVSYKKGVVDGVKRAYYKSGKVWYEVEVVNGNAIKGYVYKTNGIRRNMTKEEFIKLGL